MFIWILRQARQAHYEKSLIGCWKIAIEWILSNEKYTGNVELFKSSKSEVHYLASGSHPAIISKEAFEAVQVEKGRRSNVVRDENVVKRKSSKYSSKRWR